MSQNAMRCFLSEENIAKHKTHLNTMRSKMSIIDKSFMSKKEMDIKAKVQRAYLEKNILSHVLFFNSFKLSSGKCDNVKKYFSSKERLVYELIEISKEMDYGFVYIYVDKRGKPKIAYSSDLSEPFTKYDPILALDLYEHVYFGDYGFNKEAFLKNSMIYLDIDSLDHKLS